MIRKEIMWMMVTVLPELLQTFINDPRKLFEDIDLLQKVEIERDNILFTHKFL